MKVIVRDPALPLLLGCIMLSLPVSKVKPPIISAGSQGVAIKKSRRPFLGIRFAFGRVTRRS
jgi:hypothetical protein